MTEIDGQDEAIRLLSLDAGGPGSLSQLRIIGEYISRLAHDKGVHVDSLLPADLFEVMGGTGFGAYIALLLGPLRLPVSQAVEELVILGTTLFPPHQKEKPTAEENSERLRVTIKDMLTRRQLPIDIKLNDVRLPGSHCKVVVFAASSSNSAHCVPFRTYTSREQGPDSTFVEAACATLAIPPLFAPVSVGSQFRQQKFSSPVMGLNNITRQLLKEAAKQFGQDKRVSTILSIGSGRSSSLSVEDLAPKSYGHSNLLKWISTDCERDARELSSQLFNVEAYLRLNVDHGLEDLSMTDWTCLGDIEGRTDIYLQSTVVSNAVDSSLKALQDKIGLISLEQLIHSTQIQSKAKKVPAVSPYFVIRQEYWNAMEQLLITSPLAKRKIMVLSGMGGCGKTQMVAYFVEQHHAGYQHIFFVDASSSSSIRSDLQAAIRALGIGHERKTFEDAIKFLASGSHDGHWLLIFDNADDPDLDLVRYFPECFHGTILITTRNPELGRLSTTMHLRLGVMGVDEAYEVLIRAAHRRVPLSQDEDASARQLMMEFGNLAVALVQAGSYCYRISSTGSSDGGHYKFSQYLSLLKKHRKELMTKGDRTSLDRYTRGAYTTFDLSYTLLPQPAREILYLSAFFHHTDIPLSMLECATQNNFSDWWEFLIRPETHKVVKDRLTQLLLFTNGRWDELYIHNIIHSLQSFSLVSTSSAFGKVFLRFHPLVHSWCRDLIPPAELDGYRQMAMHVVVSCTLPSNTLLYRFLIPHMTSLIQDYSINKMHVNDLMGFARVFLELGDYPKAEGFLRDSLAITEAKLGKQQHGTSLVAGWLAQAYHRQGRWKEAEIIQVDVLEQQRRHLKKGHQNIMESASNLALTYHMQGRWKEAETLMLEVLERRHEISGRDHPDTITAAANLASIYHAQGKWQEAEKLKSEVMKQREKLLSKDHPDTIMAAANLAVTYYQQGRLKEAEEIEFEVLEQRQKLLGKDHPDTVMAAANLASTYHVQGKWNEAEKMKSKVLEQRKRLLSKDHPDTIMAAANLAATYHAQGRWNEAERMKLEVLEQRKKLLGRDHPDTILAANNLAWTYHAQRKRESAKKLQVDTVEVAKRVMGSQHPHTLFYINNLAIIRRTRYK